MSIMRVAATVVRVNDGALAAEEYAISSTNLVVDDV